MRHEGKPREGYSRACDECSLRPITLYYISRLEATGEKDHLERLRELEDYGIEMIIKVVEIKSDEEDDEATPAEEEHARVHFERLNRRLRDLNPFNLDGEHRPLARQYCTFHLLTPKDFCGWFCDLRKGK